MNECKSLNDWQCHSCSYSKHPIFFPSQWFQITSSDASSWLAAVQICAGRIFTSKPLTNNLSKHCWRNARAAFCLSGFKEIRQDEAISKLLPKSAVNRKQRRRTTLTSAHTLLKSESPKYEAVCVCVWLRWISFHLQLGSISYTHVWGVNRASERSHASRITNGSGFSESRRDRSAPSACLSLKLFLFFFSHVHHSIAQSRNNKKKVGVQRPCKEVPPKALLQSLFHFKKDNKQNNFFSFQTSASFQGET